MDLHATGRALRLNGETLTLRRVLARDSFRDVVCFARVDGYQPSELPGGVTQGTRKIVISNVEIEAAGWPGPPRRGDVVIFATGGSATVQSSDPGNIGAVVVRHTMTVTGN